MMEYKSQDPNLNFDKEIHDEISKFLNQGLIYLIQWTKYNINPDSIFIRGIFDHNIYYLQHKIRHLDLQKSVSDYYNLNCFGNQINNEIQPTFDQNSYFKGYYKLNSIISEQLILNDYSFLSYRVIDFETTYVEKFNSPSQPYFTYSYPSLKYYEYKNEILKGQYTVKGKPDIKELIIYLKTLKRKVKGKYKSIKYEM